jgi:hypothetical protein
VTRYIFSGYTSNDLLSPSSPTSYFPPPPNNSIIHKPISHQPTDEVRVLIAQSPLNDWIHQLGTNVWHMSKPFVRDFISEPYQWD